MECNYTKDTSDVIINFLWYHGSTIIVYGSVSAQTVRFQDGLWSSGVFQGDFVSSLTIQLPASSVNTSVAGQYICTVTLTAPFQNTATATIYLPMSTPTVDRLGKGIGIGVAIALPVILGLVVALAVTLKKLRKKDKGESKVTENEMAIAEPNEDGNEYEQLQTPVQVQGSSCAYQNISDAVV